jgi:L-ascorbate metabolism protein UlaG (beta-lactamase superfamily)
MPIRLTPAHHFSARGPFDRNRALWGGFMITVARRRIYFAGDTAYSPIFGEIRDRLGAPDLSLLPIGAYEPRWFMRSVARARGRTPRKRRRRVEFPGAWFWRVDANRRRRIRQLGNPEHAKA